MRGARVARSAGLVLLALVMVALGAWCALALWYRCGDQEPWRSLLAGATATVTLVAVAGLARPRWWRPVMVYGIVVALVLLWWATITPTHTRDWAPEVARSVTATLAGDRVVLRNVRNFTWRSDTDFDSRWEERTYALSHVTDVDLLMSYWMGEAIAHTIVSFGFDDAPRLAFSIEIRKEAQEHFSALAGFFKQYELALIAADERDVVRVRSNVRGEDVRLYRLNLAPSQAARLLRVYLDEANTLARTPRFYNTLTSNCTTLVFDMVRSIHPGLPLDARILFSGYVPNYAYEVGALDTRLTFARLRELARIHDKAVQADADPRFAERIRAGVPVPVPR
jgi:hypothetical protein